MNSENIRSKNAKTILVVEDSKFMNCRIIETLKNAGRNMIANAKKMAQRLFS